MNYVHTVSVARSIKLREYLLCHFMHCLEDSIPLAAKAGTEENK